MRRPTFVILVLAAGVLFFGWETYSAWTSAETPVDSPGAAAVAGSRPDPAGDNVSRDGDLSVHLAVIVTKPLFRADRQPFHENAVVTQRNYEAELSRFSLVGVLLQDDERKGLVLSAGGTRRDRWEVAAGDTLPGFTVREVLPDGLTLAADGKEFLLPLYAGGPKGQPAGPVRTEVAPGIPAVQPPGTSTAAPPMPNASFPAARPPGPVAVPPSAPAAPQTPVYTNGGIRVSPRPGRRYPLGQ